MSEEARQNIGALYVTNCDQLSANSASSDSSRQFAEQCGHDVATPEHLRKYSQSYEPDNGRATP
jgi:hypothetical protein